MRLQTGSPACLDGQPSGQEVAHRVQGRSLARGGYDDVMVDEKRKAELLKQLETLRAELDQLARTDADRAKTIAGFAELSAHEATRPKPHPELLMLSVTGLQKSVQEFEATHPRLVEIVGSLSAILSNIGL
jgi:hypothetical protein